MQMRILTRLENSLANYWGGTKRDKLNGTKGFLRKSAVSCGFLRKSAVSCGFLRKSAPPKCCNSHEKRKSAKISENLRKTAKSARFVPFSLSLLIPLELLEPNLVANFAETHTHKHTQNNLHMKWPGESKQRCELSYARGRELNPNIFFSNFSGASGISRQNPGISRQKS